jgi:hypothetical protein
MDKIDYDKTIKIDVDKDGVAEDLGTIGEMLNNFGDEWADKEIGFEATIDNTPALAGLDALLSAGEITADGITDALNTIGWDPEIEWEEHTGTAAEAMAAHGYVDVLQKDGSVKKVPVNEDAQTSETITYYVPHIKSAKKTGGGASGGKPHI